LFDRSGVADNGYSMASVFPRARLLTLPRRLRPSPSRSVYSTPLPQTPFSCVLLPKHDQVTTTWLSRPRFSPVAVVRVTSITA
jgi:hypothetical protein